MSITPIILILGPSGVGKSCVAKSLEEKYGFLHLDIDQNRGFQANGLPADWDRDIANIDFVDLANAVRTQVTNENRSAAVVSFPTIHVFTLEQLKEAMTAGISTVVLWGTEAHCMESRRIRAKKNRVRFDRDRYYRKNKRTFEIYAQPGYADFRIQAFQSDGSRWLPDQILGVIMERINMKPSITQ